MFINIQTRARNLESKALGFRVQMLLRRNPEDIFKQWFMYIGAKYIYIMDQQAAPD